MMLQTEASERLLEEGRAHLMGFRMPAAAEVFRRLAARPDGAVAAQHHLAMVSLFKALASDKEAYYDEFFERSGALDDLLDDAPPGPWRAQVAASDALHRAMAAGKADRRLKAAWAARSAFNGFEGLIERHPAFAEPYLGMGLLHFAVASLPGTYRRLLGMLGFGGTAEQGLEEMGRAAQGGRLNRELAQLALALTDVVLYQQPERGAQVLGRLYRQDPHSLLYALTYGFALIAERRVEKAEGVLRAAAARADDPAYFFLDFIEYHLADALFRQQHYRAAETHYRRYLARHQGASLRAVTYLHLGLAVEMQGRRSEAVRYYEQVTAARGFPSDAAAARRARALQKTPMTALQRQLVRGQGAYDSGHYTQADLLLEAVLRHPAATADERAEAAYRRGRVQHAQQHYEGALHSYRLAEAQPGDPRAKWGPWSTFYMGLIHEAQGQPQAAATAFERVLAYERPFDYDEPLQQAAKAALSRVRSGA